MQLLGRHTPLECHVINLAVARHLHLEPIRKRVDTLRADAVQTARKLIRTLPELAARVQVRQHQLYRGHLELRVYVHRNAAPVVLDRTRAVPVKRHVNPSAMPGKMFVDRVVENFENSMMQTPFVGRANVHARTLADTRKPLQFVDFGSVVLFGFRRIIRFVGHQDFEEFEREKWLPLNLGVTSGADNRFLNKILPKSTKYRDFTHQPPQDIGSNRS